jgi:hypothetical protein
LQDRSTRCTVFWGMTKRTCAVNGSTRQVATPQWRPVQLRQPLLRWGD